MFFKFVDTFFSPLPFPDDFVPADPHVRVGGTSSEDVEKAKAMILEFLDTKSSRVTMKMDVSYTDHSHIIGKGGEMLQMLQLLPVGAFGTLATVF